MKKLKGKKNRDGSRSGVAIIEFAMVLPILMLVSMGLVQYGIIMNTIDSLHQITRQAARVAAVNPRNDSATLLKISEVCKTTSIRYSDLVNIQVLPVNVAERVANSPITVSVTYPITKRVFLPSSLFGVTIFKSNKEVSSTYFIEGAGLSAPTPTP